MISAETIDSAYDVIHGDYNPDASYRAAVAHCHFTGDTTSSLSRIVHGAVEAGIDLLTVTDHDTTQGQDEVRGVVSRYDYPIEVFPGIEVSAVGPQRSVRHVLVYGVENAPPAGLTPVALNVWAHEQGTHVLTAAAHPEMLAFSVREKELADIQASENPAQRFDLGEITNGAVLGIDAWRKKHPLFERVLQNKMPSPTANARMSEIVFGQGDLAPIGGSDAHERAGVDNVVNLVPEGMRLFDAALAGELVIIQKKIDQVKLPTLARIGFGAGRGILLDRKVETSWENAGI